MFQKLLLLSLLTLLACSSDPSKDDAPCGDDSRACGNDGGGDAEGGSDDPPMISGAGTVKESDAAIIDNGKPPACVDIRVDTNRVTPQVILIIDQSGSMTETFDMGESRWNALRSFLLDESGLVADLQKQVKFGLALYSARSVPDGTAVDGECPLITRVAPKLDNYSKIAEAYSAAEPIKETPTGDSITAVLASLKLDEIDPDTEQDPVVFILATDGEPDRCEEPNSGSMEGQDIARQESIDAVSAAFDQGVQTFIISVGEGTVSEAHQQAVANAGLGKKAGDDDAEFWVAGDDASLRSALQKIVGAQVSCDIKLNGEVDEAAACDGTVLLGNTKLKCNGANGWKLLSPKRIRLLGDACRTLKTGDDTTLEVTFPCGTTIVF
jgi:von Willebrand factor type A domain